MNGLDFNTLRKHLSFRAGDSIRASGLSELHALQDWLIPDKNLRSDLELEPARVAPSLVTRADCELFGVAFPRFAYRVYLDKDRTIFVNVRRLPALCHQIGNKYNKRWASANRAKSANKRIGWFKRLLQCLKSWYKWLLELFQKPSQQAHNTEQYEKTPVQELLGSSFIADSLIRLIDPRAAMFHILQCDLAVEMGEPPREDAQSMLGTPFSLGLALAGLCGPNVCFMTGALMKRWANALYAVGEVAAITQPNGVRHPDGSSKESVICLSRFTPLQIIPYFQSERVGLNAAYQVSNDHSSVSEPDEIGRKKYFKICLRPYVLSGFPVVLQVSAMQMKNVYSARRLRGPNQSGYRIESQNQDHVIVVVGCSKDPGSDLFLINDPNCLAPLLHATALELYEAASASSSTSLPRFISVTPKEVLLPFETTPSVSISSDDTVTVQSDAPSFCLLDLVERTQLKSPTFYYVSNPLLPHCNVERSFYANDYRLVTIADLKDIAKPLSDRNTRTGLHLGGIDRRSVAQLVEALDANGITIDDSHWCWLQLGIDEQADHTVWLWDAQVNPPNTEELLTDAWEDVLIAATTTGMTRGDIKAGTYVNPSFTVKHQAKALDSAPTATAEPPLNDSDYKGILTPSIITSFSCKGFLDALSADPWKDCEPSSRNLDLYCFMQGDLEGILAPLVSADLEPKPEPAESVYQFCANNSNNATVIDRIARSIQQICQKNGNVKLTGVASYLPEFFSLGSEDSTQSDSHLFNGAKVAVEAVRFIVRLCKKLRNDFGFTDLRVIELVAGSQIQGIFPWFESEKKEPVFFARKQAMGADKLTQLFKDPHFLEVLAEAREAHLLFALELEPGPLYSLNTVDTLREMSEFLDNLGDSGKIIGFNLDIAHYILEGITPQDLLENHSLCQRIFHAHVSRHTQAHWCDLGFDSKSNFTQKLRPWLEVLAKLRSTPGFNYDGVVALELEAVADIEIVRRSIQTLTNAI